MNYPVNLTEAALQYIVNLLRARPHAEVDDLLRDLQAQAVAREAAAAAEQRAAIIAEHEAAAAAPKDTVA